MIRRSILGCTLAVMMVCQGAMAGEFTPAASWDVGERTLDAGDLVLTMAEEGGGEVDTVRYAGIEGKDYTDEKVYTFHDYIESTTSNDWNPQTWETNDDNVLMSYQTDTLYTFYLNEDKTGYCVAHEMAADYPVDVTSEYVGSLGVEEGETNKAWRIALNPDCCWADGTPINADDYIYSMQQQLNPKMLNRRADSWYSGDLVIFNAKNYLYSGKTAYEAITDTVENLLAAGDDIYVDMWGLWGMEGALDADGNECPQYCSINDETMYRDAAVEDETADEAWVSGKYIFEAYLADGMPYADYQGEYLFTGDIAPETAWEDVGLKKIDDYTIDIILASPIQEASFYLPYNLSSTWLVYKPLFEECKSFFDADGNPVETEEEAATVTTDYCKSVEKTMSFGPYKMSYYELDKQISYVRNENWHGYHDGNHLGMFQTDNISITVIPEHNTALLAFLAGEIDSVSLQAEDMERFASSDYIQYTPQTYTTKVSFNTNYDKLLEHGTGSQILVVDEFRKAFAFAIDRQHFATAYTSAGTAGFGILNENYIYSPFTGAQYRASDYSKAALCDIYEMSYGEGGDYADVDEAYAAMTGYDMAKAQELMQVAYEKAVAGGIYDGESPITIDFRVYQNDTIYVQMFTYFDQQLQEACKGTGFEGKVSMTMTVDPDYYETMYSGNADAIFTTWGGASMDPFGVFARCYTDAADGSGNQMEYGYDTDAVNVTFTVEGEEITASLNEWAKWADREPVPTLEEKLGKYTDYGYDTRCQVAAAVEKGLLNWYVTTPVYYRNVASLHSQKYDQACDSFVNELAQQGTYVYFNYHYDDDEWAEYISQGELNY